MSGRRNVTVTVAENDRAGLNLSSTDLAVTEGGTATFTVRLTTQPSADVTVSVPQPSNTDVTVDKTELTFTSSNWNTAQTVTVSAAEDDDAIADSGTSRLSATGGGYVGVIKDLSYTVAENDRIGVTLSEETRLFIIGAGSSTFTVKLQSQPSADVTASVYSSTSGISGYKRFSLTPGSLTFTPSNWNTPQTVTVSNSSDHSPGSRGLIEVSARGGDYDSSYRKSLYVRVAQPGLTVSATGKGVNDSPEVTVNEGGNSTFTVRLTIQSNADVTVTATQPSTSNGSVTLSPATMTFTSSNWETPQTVTVSAAEDADSSDESGLSTLVANGGGYSVRQNVSVKVTDNDTAVALALSSLSMTLDEGGNDTFTVKLSAQPSATVTVGVSQAGHAILAVDRTSLTFNSSNWNDAQTVRVTAGQDVDSQDDVGSVLLSTGSGNFDSVSVTVTDDERALDLSASSLNIDEGGSGTFTVKLKGPPVWGTVDVRVVQPANTDVTVDTNPNTTGNQNRLAFTTDNWNTAQTVTVTTAQDDDIADDTARIQLSAWGGGFDGVADSLSVTVTDDDGAPGLILSGSPLTIDEGGNGTFTVKLTGQPSDDVTVTLTQPSNTDVTVDTDADETGNQNTLTFTTDNWNTAQTVTVVAAEDDDGIDDSATISLSASGGGFDGVTGSAAVTVTDDERALDLSGSPLTIDEGGSGTFTVKLKGQPSAKVTLTLTQPTNTDVTVDTDTDTAENQNTLTFTVDDWDTAQTVTVTAGQDDDDSDDSATISLSASGGGFDGVIGSAAVTVTDDDDALVLSAISLTIDEGGDGSFTVRLASDPGESRTVDLVSDNSDVTLNPASLSFTPANWNAAQNVAVSAAQDEDSEDDSAIIRLTGTRITAGAVTVMVTDDDRALDLSGSPLTVDEGGSGTFTVKLKGQPSATVTVTLTQPANTDVTVDTDEDETGNQNTLTFTTANWDTAQDVAVSAASDDDSTDDTATIALSASGGGFDDVIGSAAVTVTDDERALDLSGSPLTIEEGGNGTFTVRLKGRPSDEVTVTLTQPSNTDVTVDTNPNTTGNQNTLTFTTANWDTAQDVAVSAASDADAVDDSATIALSASGGGFDGVADSVSVTVTDSTPGLVIVGETDPNDMFLFRARGRQHHLHGSAGDAAKRGCDGGQAEWPCSYDIPSCQADLYDLKLGSAPDDDDERC